MEEDSDSMTKKALYTSYITENPDMSNRDIAMLIVANDDAETSIQSVIRGLQRVRQEIKQSINTSDPVFEGKYQFVEADNKVVFNIGRFLVRCGDIVDEWYQMYTSGSLSIEKMARMFNEDKDDMKRMMSALGLTKDSPERAPWVIARSIDNLDEVAEDTVRKITQRHVRLLQQKKSAIMEAEFAKMKLRESRRESFYKLVGMYSEAIPYIEPKVLEYDFGDTDFSINLVSVLSDWHVGAKGIEGTMLQGEAYSSEVRSRRLDQLSDEMARYRRNFRGNINEIKGFILGDMLDDPMSKTFENQSREQDLYGAQQVLAAVRSLTNHILTHHHLFGAKQTWYMVRGNHGYEFEDVLYLWLKENLKEYSMIEMVPISTKYAVTWDEFSDTQIMALHGESSVSEEAMCRMLEDGSSNRLILNGHSHHLLVKEMSKGYRVQCPSLMGGNAYSQSNNFNSKAGQVMIELHKDGPRPSMYLPVR